MYYGYVSDNACSGERNGHDVYKPVSNDIYFTYTEGEGERGRGEYK